jgi:hypothetical protein
VEVSGASLVCTTCGRPWTAKLLKTVLRFRKPAPDAVLSFVYEPPTRSGHEDVVVRVGPRVFRSDSYYFILDYPEGVPADPAASMRAMLGHWRRAVDACAAGSVTHLPHDFSDEYTRWIRVRGLPHDQLELASGWAAFEGWAFSPSHYPDALRDRPDALDDLKIDDHPPIVAGRAAVLEGIDQSIDALR